MKTLEEIWNECYEEQYINEQNTKELAWHMEYDKDPSEAIDMATDMILEVGYSSHLWIETIAKHLDNKSDDVRVEAINSLLTRLHIYQYAEKALKIAKENNNEFVRGRAIYGLGNTIKYIKNKILQRAVAKEILSALKIPIGEWDICSEAYCGILIAIGVDILDIPQAWQVLGKDYQIDEEKVKEFERRFLRQEKQQQTKKKHASKKKKNCNGNKKNKRH